MRPSTRRWRWCAAASASRPSPTPPAACARASRCSGEPPGADRGIEIRNAARSELAALAAQGAVDLPVAAFALTDVAAAHRLSAQGHPPGKLVLIP
jgi:NADPH:quinone reductase-like Zn-dependent oxidoreductase